MIKVFLQEKNVLEATQERIISLFKNGKKVYWSFSGGKDSIVLDDILYKLCLSGQIDKNNLEVLFVDEEGMYDDVIELTKKTRLKWLAIGVPFSWYCIQIRHNNCLNSLSDEDSFICWEESQKDKWIRTPPKFAITSDKDLVVGKDTYQSWWSKKEVLLDGITLIGVRAYESLQRFTTFGKSTAVRRKMFPIFDWQNDDIWYYIKINNLEFPKTYMYMYEIGIGKNRLRISQFFSTDTVHALNQIVYFYPNMYNAILKREPNSYLAMLYFDTDMFKNKKSVGNKMIKLEDDKDYKDECMHILFNGNDRNVVYSADEGLIRMFRNWIMNNSLYFTQKTAKKMYGLIITGDLKRRGARALIQDFSINKQKEIK